MRYLFWNTNKKNLDSVICDIVAEFSCDVISIAEYGGNIKELIMHLNKNELTYFKVNEIANQRVMVITKYRTSQIRNLYDAGYFTIKIIPHDTLGIHIVAFVHLPSKLRANDLTRFTTAQRLKNEIERVEEENKCDRTIIIGDFNMNPYEEGMAGASALHCLSSREIAKKCHRTVLGKKCTMFYNPMWSFMGDVDLPDGSYYYDDSSQELNYYWNVFDQVVIRPSLIEFFNPSKVKVLYKTSRHNLLNERGRPEQDIYSDHLPLYFEL